MELVSMAMIGKKEEEKKEDNSINSDEINEALNSTDEKEKLNIENDEQSKGDIIVIKNADYYKKRIKKILTNKVFIGFFLIYLLYFLSLEGCYLGEDMCSEKKKAWMKVKVIEEIISGIIMTVFIQLMMFKKVSKMVPGGKVKNVLFDTGFNEMLELRMEDFERLMHSRRGEAFRQQLSGTAYGGNQGTALQQRDSVGRTNFRLKEMEALKTKLYDIEAHAEETTDSKLGAAILNHGAVIIHARKRKIYFLPNGE